jgi:hypothetical protein
MSYSTLFIIISEVIQQELLAHGSGSMKKIFLERRPDRKGWDEYIFRSLRHFPADYVPPPLLLPESYPAREIGYSKPILNRTFVKVQSSLT